MLFWELSNDLNQSITNLKQMQTKVYIRSISKKCQYRLQLQNSIFALSLPLKVIVSLLLENTTSLELQLGSNATGSSYFFSHSMTFRGRGSLGSRFLLPTDRMRTRRHCSWRLSQHWNIQAELFLKLISEKEISTEKIHVDVTTFVVPLFG